MTRRSSFKRLVRARMAKTGESYTAARTRLLAAHDQEPSGRSASGTAPRLATSDESIRRRTGRGWEQWFDLLDEWGAAERSHRDIARWVAGQLGIEPLAWNAQAVAGGYERARGIREVGERADGFAVTAQKTMMVSPDRLFDLFVDESLRRRWLPDGELRERTATKPRSARFDWLDGETRVHVVFDRKGERATTVAVEHARLADADEAERMKTYWRERLATLKGRLERGEIHA
ncbi:hypothetical protein [Amycolatopsis cihanbeyliensis]|uniref:Activator of Hsp90 ATPase-like protein n=1 Tax=Amycolatopsis cihanbeyliensis TaxID=1128664 RepID=A0A542DFY0_AMYCI|nr:hypothetical protein [Amycolatopsis cihanbeyliensis]TQJ01941.1 hypothetical protein FB471_1657 [Amycolatopsis cihanbeyliensis]